MAFGFGAAVGALIGYLLGRQTQVPAPGRARPAPPSLPPPSFRSASPASPEIKHVVLDEGSANVLNALNNRLAAIGALADLLHGSPLDPERARALVLLHGEVRRAAEITSHFLELAAHPAGAAEPCDAAVVINGVLAERESTFRELGVKVVRAVPGDLPMVACPMAQLTEMLTKLLDFSLRRLRASQPPRELRLEVIATGPSIVASLWDSGTPLAVEAEQRLTSPFRFTQTGGGGEVEFALARALAQSAGGNLRLRPRGGNTGAEVVVTLPRSLLGAHTPLSTPAESLPRMRILVVDDDAVNRQAMVLLLGDGAARRSRQHLRRHRHGPADAAARRARDVRAARQQPAPRGEALRVRHGGPGAGRDAVVSGKLRTTFGDEALRFGGFD